MAISALIAGLGNPEAKYVGTRHNMGFAVVDELVNRFGLTPQSGAKYKCNLWKGRVSGPGECLCAEPLTYMNLSGECVQPLAAWHRLEPAQILVIHDELDLPAGRMKFKKGGGNAGHNGLKSITQMLGTPDFYRLRVGIGKPAVGDTYSWVLGKPSPEARLAFEKMLPAILECVELFVGGDAAAAQRTANAYTSDELPPTKSAERESN